MRRFLLLVVFPALLMASAPMRADLVAHWPLDGSGEDFIGGFDGIVTGGVSFGAPGANENTGEAASFQNGSIDIPFAPEINPESFTITLWAKPVGGSGHRSPITCRYDGIVAGGGNLDGFIIYNAPNNSWQFWTGDGESAIDGWDALAGPPVEMSQWQHLAISFDAETQEKSFYINGLLLATSPSQGYAPVTDISRALHIGGGGDMGTQYRWAGDLDDVGLWNEVLNEEEIFTIMDDGVESFEVNGLPPCPGEGDPDYADTHCTLLEVEATGVRLGPSHYLTVEAEDETGDGVLVTVTVDREDVAPIVIGPQALGRIPLWARDEGLYRVTVVVDDSMRCEDAAEDSTCQVVIGVGAKVSAEECDNGEDDDLDGFVDCEDPDCEEANSCQGGGGPVFRRGDPDDNGSIQLTDGIFILNFLFLGGTEPPCSDAADADDNGAIQLTDGILILNFLFLGGDSIPAPFPECGGDRGEDPLTCDAYSHCP